MIRVCDKHGNVAQEFSSELLARNYMLRHKGMFIHPDDIRAMHETVSPFYREYLKFTPRRSVQDE